VNISLRWGKNPALDLEINALFVIAPYKYEGMWVFDDPAAGLTKESFVAVIDLMIEIFRAIAAAKFTLEPRQDSNLDQNLRLSAARNYCR
jgi:hypothetical protein